MQDETHAKIHYYYINRCFSHNLKFYRKEYTKYFRNFSILDVYILILNILILK